jgi:hypothetical protein
MLATLLRHTGRLEEAVEHLDRLQRMEGSEKWGLEIQRERELLANPLRRNTLPNGQPAVTVATDVELPLKDAA